VCELTITLELIVVTSFRSPMNSVINPKPVCSLSYHVTILFSGNRKQGVKPEKENVGDLPHSKVRRFHSGDEAEPQERKEKNRKHEEKDVGQVS
jgi:hypothetical protein